MCVGEVGGGGNGDGATSAVPPCPITLSPQVDKERNLRRCSTEFTYLLKSIEVIFSNDQNGHCLVVG